jgi:hypothetical protein
MCVGMIPKNLAYVVNIFDITIEHKTLFQSAFTKVRF